MNIVMAGKYAGSPVKKLFGGVYVKKPFAFGISKKRPIKAALAIAVIAFFTIIITVGAFPFYSIGDFLLTVLAGMVLGCFLATPFIIHKDWQWINGSTVVNHEIITEESVKSASSGVARGIVGGVLLGPVGMLGGALSAKNITTRHVAIEWRDGERSLLAVKGDMYNALASKIFR